MAVFCLSTLFVGCDQKCTPHADENADLTCDNCSEALEAPACKPHTDANTDYVCDNCSEKLIAPCEAHKDENADKHCDVCGLAIVIITEIVEPTVEERVDMIVNPIPENGNIGDYTSYVDNSTALSAVVKELNGTIQNINYFMGYAYLTATEQVVGEETYFNNHYIIDLETGKSIFETSDRLSSGIEKNYVNIYLNDFYFVVIENYTTYDEYGMPSFVNVFEYRAYDNTVLFDVTAAYDDLSFWNDAITYEKNNVTYFEFDNTVYAFDTNSGELIDTLNKIDLIYRPAFDVVTEKYGYVYMDNSVFVYDLSKWVDCVYSYTAPSFYEGSDFFVINDGRILVQAAVRLLDSAVSYDVIENGGKYDIVYIIIDPTAKTETAVEFGYYITNACDWSNEDKALNYVEAYPIVNDRIDYNNELTLVTDKDLNITLSVENDNFRFVTENIMLVTEEISEGLFVRKLVNATTGKLIAYVPENAMICNDYIYYDGIFYNFSMQEVLDLAADGFIIPDLRDINKNFALLTKVVEDTTEEDPNAVIYEHYFFNANGLTKIEIENLVAFIGMPSDAGYIVAHNASVIDENDDTVKIVYTFYNSNNKPIFTSDARISEYYTQIGDTYIFSDGNGTLYFVK